MASRLVSRLLPAHDDAPSIYETLQQNDDHSEEADWDRGASMAVDEENLRTDLQTFAAEDVSLSHSHLTAQSVATKPQGSRGRESKTVRSRKPDVEDADDEVPPSLLVEGDGQGRPGQTAEPLMSPEWWDTTTRTNALDSKGHEENKRASSRRNAPEMRAHRDFDNQGRENPSVRGLSLADPRQKAMWRWANVENLDVFLMEVYLYYLGSGFLSIMLQRTLQMLTFAFVAGFTMFLGNCIQYDKLRHSGNMSQVLVPRCARKLSTSANIAIWALALLWMMKLFQYLLDIRRLRNLHDFYKHLLGITDLEIQSISWQEIVSRLMALRDANPNTADTLPPKNRRFLGSQSKQRMDAHDIANRLMRRDNYLIALFNKEILDVTLPLPWIGKRQLFSRTLEWNINQCVIDYVFNQHGQVRSLFLKDTHRRALSEGLRRRFRFAATLNIFVAPFLVAYFLVHYFFSYFTEYQRNPSQIGSRQYTPLAEWKFREFNELHHLFKRRMNMSYPFASRYIDQFPKDKTVQISKFIAFVAGALASVLAVASVLDPELFLNFEITKDRSVIFYLGVFGTIWAVARGVVPEENLVYEPAFALQEVINFTHYQPAHWEGRLHADEVRKEFAAFYQLKILIFVEEILSMIFTPFVLWFSLPSCSDRIIDFFREFTVHVDGLGFVCSFAEFNFQHNGRLREHSAMGQSNAPQGSSKAAKVSQHALREDYFATKDQKLEASYWGFMNDYARNPNTNIRFPYVRRKRQSNRFPVPSSVPRPSPTTATAQYRPILTEVGNNRPDKAKGTPRPHAPTLGLASGAEARSKLREADDSAEPAVPTFTSPLASVLLDPHHQPAPSGFVQHSTSSRQQRQDTQSRVAPSLSSEVATKTQDTGFLEEVNTARQAEESGEGILGSSWKLRQDQGSSEEEEEDVEDVVGDKGPGGILGMVVQFQKSQAGGPAAGSLS